MNNKIKAIKCDNCKVIFQKTKNRISYKFEDWNPCPFCGIVTVNNIPVLSEMKINKSELTTLE